MTVIAKNGEVTVGMTKKTAANGRFSAKINGSSSIEHYCKTEHLCYNFRHFAKLQKVSRKAKNKNNKL